MKLSAGTACRHGSWNCARPLPRCPQAARLPPPLAQAQVVCLGEGLFDMLADQKGKSKEEVETWSGYPGGAPCNVAAGLARLGIPVAFASALGKDSKGDELFTLLSERGVIMDAVQRVEAPTRDVFVVRTMDGDRIFDSFGQDTSTYCDCFIDPDALPANLLQGSQVLVMGTLGLAYDMTGKAMARAADMATAAGTTVLIDLNWRPVFFPQPDSALDLIMPFLAKADLLKITDDECEFALGIPADEAIGSPQRVMDALPGLRGVLVTGGAAGAGWCVRAADGALHSGFVPVYKVDVQDTTGAGDAFTCGFLAYMLAEEGGTVNKLLASPESMDAAVKFAAACGALTTTSAGAIAAQPELADVEEMVKTGTAASAA